ncbi:MAG TPA: hypothetical protein VFN02_05890, partial [Ktedonobacteraceae bacterium]|nr:hypothetical protein [Ktedonobacteraceae bacterium]
MKKSSRKQRRSLQNDYILMREIDENVMYLGSTTAPTKRELVASLKVSGTNLALKSTDEQIALMSRWRDLLSSLHYPIQILTQIVPLDISMIRAQYEGAGSGEEGETERQLRSEHLAFIQHVQESHTLFTRTSHILVPSRPSQFSASSIGTIFLDLLWPPRRKRRQRKQRQETFQHLQQQLDLRVRDLSRMLARMHLPSERLGGDSLLQFYASCVLAKRALSPLKPVIIRALDHALHPTPILLPPEPSENLWEGEPLV